MYRQWCRSDQMEAGPWDSCLVPLLPGWLTWMSLDDPLHPSPISVGGEQFQGRERQGS